MKFPVLSFAAGAAAGAFVMWLVTPPADDDSRQSGGNRTVAGGPALSEEKEKLAARVQALERELKAARSEGESAEDTDGEGSKPAQVFATPFDDKGMEEMLRRRADRDVNREVDRTALRLKLTAEQKESLRRFLMDAKERERAMFQTAMRNGGEAERPEPGQSKEEFLKSILTADQQAEYERSREEQRTARAEDYAQRKVRKLNNDLNLSEEQKDRLFQAYAQQKLAATDPAKSAEPADVVARTGGAVAFAAVGSAAGGAVEPIEVEFDTGDFTIGGGNDIERATLESILTPEQLAVYDQRRAEEQVQLKKIINVEGLPVPPPVDGEGASGSVIRIEKRAIPAPPGAADAPAGDAPK
jgi:hypothetical protein